MNSLQIAALDFDYYRSAALQYFQAGFKGLGPSDEFLAVYCMGGEL